MGFTHPDKYTLFVRPGSTNPLDSTTYYFGNSSLTWTTTAAASRILVPVKGVIREIYIFIYCTAGTAENCTFYLRKNNTSDTEIDTVTLDSTAVDLINTNINVAVNAGDYLEIKITTPAWVGNPTGVYVAGIIIVESA